MRPPRFAICRNWYSDGTAHVLCHGHRWAWMHNRGRVRLPRRLLATVMLYTTFEQANEIATAYGRAELHGAGFHARRPSVIGWLAYCSDDEVDHEDCRAHPGLSRACIEARRSGRDLVWRNAS